DLSFLYGNTDDGMHAASLGGTWQAAVNGFAGTRVSNSMLSIDPRLPENWKEMSFCMRWQGRLIRIAARDNSVSVCFYSKRKKDKFRIRVYGVSRRIEPNKQNIFRAERRRKS
ncbi:glycosyl hydrolase family 65 protein, partial [Candidatus Omnitrophota bacterium]